MSEIDPVYEELTRKLRMEGSEYMPKILQKLANLDGSLNKRCLEAKMVT